MFDILKVGDIMFALLVYDIPNDEDGKKRYYKLYNLCKSHGWHVQKSVFELDIDYGSLMRLEHKIENVIDKDVDSVRIYYIGKARTDTNVILLGKREMIESNDSTIII